MTYPSLAIIGTAGRNDDYDKLSKQSYERMVIAVSNCLHYLSGLNRLSIRDIKVFSGGAAWADHVAVGLCLERIIPFENLTIFAPTEFKNSKFTGVGFTGVRTADTINYHHRRFSEKISESSLGHLAQVQRKGAVIVPGNGNFKDRNTKIAESVTPNGLLIAFTFGHNDCTRDPWVMMFNNSDTTATEAGVKPGGTADTFNKAYCRKAHVKLEQLFIG